MARKSKIVTPIGKLQELGILYLRSSELKAFLKEIDIDGKRLLTRGGQAMVFGE